jgi:enamine deaminase RidA (YjgF/YER057c/UK114 family)
VSGLEAVHPDGWPRGSGYSHAMAAEGRILCVAGQVGWDPVTQQVVPGGFVAQAEQALRNVAAILAAAGARPEHAARMTWYITDRQAYLDGLRDVGAAYRRIFGNHYPAMSVVVVSGLIEPGALLEIEVTAIVG